MDTPGPNLPCLYLSPDHTLYIDEVFIPVKHLTNDSIIARVACDEIARVQVAPPQHAVWLAESLPAKAYLETGGPALATTAKHRVNSVTGHAMRAA